MGQQKKPFPPPKHIDQVLEVVEVETDHLERLHPSLRANFVPLPEINSALTDEQLAEIFGGDWKALHDVIRLARKIVPENMDE
jgi:hypothetical protein